MTKGKVGICTPSLSGPTAPNVAAVVASLPLIKEAGWSAAEYYHELGNAYISQARSSMMGKALRDGCDVIVFIDYDLSWKPEDLLKLIETEGDVVAGTYRFKEDKVHFMTALFVDENDQHIYREDGCVLANRVCAGFLKFTRNTVARFSLAYPNLVYKKDEETYVDIFNHGAHNGQWWGEDYAFCRNWNAIGGQVWLVPDLDLTHHAGDKAYPGNFKESLAREAKRKANGTADASPESRMDGGLQHAGSGAPEGDRLAA